MSFLKEEVDLGEEYIETEGVDIEPEGEVDIETEEIDIETVEIEDVTRYEIYHDAIDVDQNPPQPVEIEAIDVETGDVTRNENIDLVDPIHVDQNPPQPNIECFSCLSQLSYRHRCFWSKCKDADCSKILCPTCVTKNKQMKRGTRCLACSGAYNRGKTSTWRKCDHCGFWSHWKCHLSCRCILRTKMSGHRF